MSEQITRWIQGSVARNTHWTPNLFSLCIDADVAPFQAGQYTALALDIAGERIAQPYSILSSPDTAPLEFFFHTPRDGQLSAALGRLQEGDRVWVQQTPEGRFTLDAVPDGRELWLLATGTGVSPFLSLLCTPQPWERFEHIVLVYAVRHWNDIAYHTLIEQLRSRHGERFTFIPFVSREKVENTLQGQIPARISDGTLENVARRPFTLERSRFMLCGNPGMVQDALAALQQRGFVRSTDGRSGHITLEAYW
jgi:ferredoxin--NADP+ reductase